MPRSRSVKPLRQPMYEQFHSITRCLHLRDAMICYGKKKLIAHKVNSTAVDVDAKVLWFAPSKSKDENNFYGNVSFSIPLKSAMAHLGAPKYYLDQEETSTHIYTRVLMTKQIHPNLKEIGPGNAGAPFIMEGTAYYSAVRCEDGGMKPHVLELGIEADNETQKWLYKNCVIETNNHSGANTLNPYTPSYRTDTCHRFNSFQSKCPSPYTKNVTHTILQKRCPGMLHQNEYVSYRTATYESDEAVLASLLVNDEIFTHDEVVHDYDDHERSSVVQYKRGVCEPDYTSTESSSSSSFFSARSYESGAAGGSWLTQQSSSTEWSTGEKIGVAAGVVAVGGLIAVGLAALFGDTDEKPKKKSGLN